MSAQVYKRSSFIGKVFKTMGLKALLKSPITFSFRRLLISPEQGFGCRDMSMYAENLLCLRKCYCLILDLPIKMTALSKACSVCERFSFCIVLCAGIIITVIIIIINIGFNRSQWYNHNISVEK
jgi:hypothetical protein